MNIIISMEQNANSKGVDNNMGEKVYKIMKHTGAGAIVLGIITIVFGVAVGIMSIINGAKLVKGKRYISF